MTVHQRTLNANGQIAFDFLDLAYDKLSEVSIQLSGTFVATVTYEVSNNGTTWVALNMVRPDGSAAASSDTTAGIRQATIKQRYFRARVSAFTSGSVVLDLVAS